MSIFYQGSRPFQLDDGCFDQPVFFCVEILNALTYAVRGKVILQYTAQLTLIQAILVPAPVMVIDETWWHDTWGRAVFFQLCENAAFPRTDHRRGYRGR